MGDEATFTERCSRHVRGRKKIAGSCPERTYSRFYIRTTLSFSSHTTAVGLHVRTITSFKNPPPRSSNSHIHHQYDGLRGAQGPMVRHRRSRRNQAIMEHLPFHTHGSDSSRRSNRGSLHTSQREDRWHTVVAIRASNLQTAVSRSVESLLPGRYEGADMDLPILPAAQQPSTSLQGYF